MRPVRFPLNFLGPLCRVPAWTAAEKKTHLPGVRLWRSQKAGSAWRPAYRLRTLRHSARPPATLALPSLPLSLRPTPQRPPPSPLALPSLPCSQLSVSCCSCRRIPDQRGPYPAKPLCS